MNLPHPCTQLQELFARSLVLALQKFIFFIEHLIRKSFLSINISTVFIEKNSSKNKTSIISTHQSNRRLKSKSPGTQVKYQPKSIAFFRSSFPESYRPSYHGAFDSMTQSDKICIIHSTVFCIKCVKWNDKVRTADQDKLDNDVKIIEASIKIALDLSTQV